MSTSQWLYVALVGAVGLERLAELVISRRNAAWAFARGGVEDGRGHYPWMVGLHVALLVGCVAEVSLLDRPFIPAVGWTMLALVAGSQALRWWCIATLGRQWNTRVIVVPGMSRIAGGPYRWLPHPNYVAVVLEGVALPLVHGGWLTATVFTALNAALLTARVRTEDRALRSLAGAPAVP